MTKGSIEDFFYWINERHKIFLAKEAGEPWPWTQDEVLQNWKFTNPFREYDKTTVWMRENFTNPNKDRPVSEQIFNACLFRMFGTMEFAEKHGWVYDEWDMTRTMGMARALLELGEKVFTGAYIITNRGISAPKEQVVCKHFLKPIWENRQAIAVHMHHTPTLQHTHKFLGQFEGWGGGGFMAYEVVTDFHRMGILPATDARTWANAGPGAIRGLNRIHGRELKHKPRAQQTLDEMRDLMARAPEFLDKHVMKEGDMVDMRMIEHSLCEFDKYCRVSNGEGKPRSKYKHG